MFGLTASYSKLTQALWLLDHRDFTEAVDMLLDPLISASDVKPWHHSLVVRALHHQGYHHLARDYICMKRPVMRDEEDVRWGLLRMVSVFKLFTFTLKIACFAFATHFPRNNSRLKK